MTSTGLFLLRAGGVAGVAAGAAILWFSRAWGLAALPCLLYAALTALLLGWIGYHSMGRAMICERHRIPPLVLGGLVLRLVVLITSQALVFWVFGGEWGRRTLLAAVVIYLLVLGVEVYTLNRDLASGAFRPPRTPARGGEE